MKIINEIAKFAGKKNFEIDDNIETPYILGVCLKYGFMKIRGIFLSFFNKKIDNSIYIGKSVKLYSKRNLKIGKNVKLHDYVKIDALSKNGVKIR